METIAAHRRLSRMGMFAHVVELRSFSEAARVLGVSKSAVSTQSAEIEASLGVQLLLRTTRRLAVTEAGNTYYQSCARVIAEANAVEQSIGDLHHKPVGTLRVNGPVEFGASVLTPLVTDFLRRYPDVRIELTLQDDRVDLIATGTDVAIRIGKVQDSSLIARRIKPIRRLLVASPDYLERRGRPTHPDQLADHDFAIYSLLPNPRRLELVRHQRRYRIAIKGTFASNNGNARRIAALAGIGIAHLPDFYVAGDVAAGTLVPLLTGFEMPVLSLHALYVPGSVTAKQRLFVDFLIERLQRTCPTIAPST